MSTTTQTLASTGVNAFARSVTVVAQELYGAMVQITDAYGMHSGCLTGQFEVVMNGLQILLATRQMSMAVLEVYDASDRLIQRWDFPIQYEKSQRGEERFNTQLKALTDQLAALKPANSVYYRLLCPCPNGSVRIPGWGSAPLADASHLKSETVVDNLVDTAWISVKANLHR